MEIYKDLNSPASQQFEKLLNSQLSKNKIEEGKIIEGKITKITDKYVFLFIPGLKSEPVIDINEMKMIGMQDKVVEGRDIGSKIMPDADLKLFFTCSIKQKARRRLKEFKTLNKKISLKEVENALIQRDKEDTKRKISPLIMTKNAVLVDTTKLTIKQMEAKLTNLVKKSIKKKYGNL